MPKSDNEFEGFRTHGQDDAEQRAGRMQRQVTIWRAAAVVLGVLLLGSLIGGPRLLQTTPGTALGNGPSASAGASATLLPNADGHLDNFNAMAAFAVNNLHATQDCPFGGQPQQNAITSINFDLSSLGGHAIRGGTLMGSNGWTGAVVGGPNLPWNYSDKLTPPLQMQWQESLVSFGSALSSCQAVFAFAGPDWDGALRWALDQPQNQGSAGMAQVPMIVGPGDYNARFGDVCSGSCGDGQVYAVLDPQHVYVWKNGSWQFFGPVASQP
jgi:hypothetical protein